MGQDGGGQSGVSCSAAGWKQKRRRARVDVKSAHYRLAARWRASN
jgi:hypothetical protein